MNGVGFSVTNKKDSRLHFAEVCCHRQAGCQNCCCGGMDAGNSSRTYILIYALLGDILEYLEQVVPYHLYSGNEQTLIGSVYIAQCGAETYHVKVGVAL